MNKLGSVSFKYGLIFLSTGFLVSVYSKIIFNYADDINIGERFKSNVFLQSDLFEIVGIIQIFIGLIYLIIYFKNKFHLIDKATIRGYWFTIPLITSLLMTPILDEYYPTSKYGDTFLTEILDYYLILSTILFFIGIYYFGLNFIKSIYVYYKK